jgi:hypothetical protein
MEGRSAISLADLLEKSPDPLRYPHAFNEIHRCQYRARNGEDQRGNGHWVALGCFFVLAGTTALRFGVSGGAEQICGRPSCH